MGIVPNTFQTFNIYVDRAMELLTDSEFRVLIFATRHILGWQSNINSRTAEISISMFVDGYTDKNDHHYGGCGLSRGTVIQTTEALVQFGFLDRVGKPTPKGQRWQLSDRDIDWKALEARRDEQQANNKKRLKKTRAGLQKSEGGLSNSTSAVAQTGSGLMDSTVTGLTNRHNQSQSHVQNHNKPQRTASRPALELNPIKDAIVNAFGWSWEKMSKTEKGRVQKAAAELFDANQRAGNIPALYACCKGKYEQFGPNALCGVVSEVAAKTKPNGAKPHTMSPKPKNEPEKKPLTPEEFRRLKAQGENHE